LKLLDKDVVIIARSTDATISGNVKIDPSTAWDSFADSTMTPVISIDHTLCVSVGMLIAQLFDFKDAPN